jgi:hypothetical protein
MTTTLFKKQVPTDFVPAEPGPIASISYKGLEWLHDDVFFIRYYTCGVHYRGLDVAVAKYNSLTSLKR